MLSWGRVSLMGEGVYLRGGGARGRLGLMAPPWWAGRLKDEPHAEPPPAHGHR